MSYSRKNPYIHIQKPNDLKLRPIIAGPACETNRISNLLDIILKPLLKYIKSYVKDDLDILRYLPSEIDTSSLLVTFDVVNLYSNIPHEFGIEALDYWITTYPNEIPERFEKQFILEAMDFILKNNYFYFNLKAFKQIKGTAMGTKVAPTYANLVMGYLETILYREVKNQIFSCKEEFIQNWKRYLDDCLIIWSGSQNDLIKLNRIINNIHPDFQFTMEISDKDLPFLDILIRKQNNKIETDIYYKTTDTKHI